VALARVLTANRKQTRRLRPATITEQLDDLFATGEAAGVFGSKPCGTGDGGRSGSKTPYGQTGGEIIAFQFARDAADY